MRVYRTLGVKIEISSLSGPNQTLFDMLPVLPSDLGLPFPQVFGLNHSSKMIGQSRSMSWLTISLHLESCLYD